MTRISLVEAYDNRDTVTQVLKAIDTSNHAVDVADESVKASDTAVSKATTAQSAADEAQSKADNAIITANDAVAVANGIDGKAQLALDTAKDADATANSIASMAEEALDKSTDAVITATGIDGKAQLALDTADSSVQLTGDQKVNNIKTFNGLESTNKRVEYETVMGIMDLATDILNVPVTMGATEVPEVTTMIGYRGADHMTLPTSLHKCRFIGAEGCRDTRGDVVELEDVLLSPAAFIDTKVKVIKFVYTPIIRWNTFTRAQTTDLWITGDKVVPLQTVNAIEGWKVERIHVPGHLLSEYKQATNWVTVSDMFVGI